MCKIHSNSALKRKEHFILRQILMKGSPFNFADASKLIVSYVGYGRLLRLGAMERSSLHTPLYNRAMQWKPT